MNKKPIWILLFACILAGGVFFRVWRLADRPMHTDEAVHAEKLKALLQEGFYAYDPNEFHGPTLNYFTLIPAWLRGEKTYAQIDEITLRIVPAFFGTLLILSPLFFIRQLTLRCVFLACTLLAFSPIFVYYSRYYIQETLLVLLTSVFLGAIWNYLQSHKILWILLAGISLGLMHATKETFIFVVIAVGFAWIVCRLKDRQAMRIKPLHLLVAILAAVLVSILFYSSFGTNWKGPADSLATYVIWAARAGGKTVHIHPWYYYLNLLTWIEFIEPITWNEDGIVALALFGFVMTWRKTDQRWSQSVFLEFIAVYTLILTVIYCTIPYKTPWNMMTFVYGMAILAAFAGDRLLQYAHQRWSKVIVWGLLFVYGLASPVVQSWMLNFEYASDSTNPYVYAHTGTDIFKMVDVLENTTKALTEGRNTTIQFIAAGSDYWPFPWYLRTFSHVGYWDYVDDSVIQSPIILTNAEHEQEFLNVLYTVPPAGQKHLYVPLFDETFYLRPGVEWRGYIRKDVWDQMRHEPLPTISSVKEKGSALKVQPNKKTIDNLVKFSHQAMNSNFEVFIQHEDGTYAGRAARAAFHQVDRLEQILSRFIENSDVSRINQLSPGDFIIVDEDTMQCLQIARQAWQLTDGAFDVTIGRLITAWKSNNSRQAEALLANRPSTKMLDLDDLSVKVLGENISVDLGGIGKGYAVDKIAEILAEWGIKKALIHGGASSVLAMDPPEGKTGWKITLSNPIDDSTIVHLDMKNQVLSCSGLQQGQHIINPFTGQPTDRRACWVLTRSNAALADALTTAAMLMPMEKIQSLQEQMPEMAVMLLSSTENHQPKLQRMGDWPNGE